MTPPPARTLQAEPEYLERLRRKIAGQRVPYTGGAALTHRCNVRCVHCYCGDQGAVRGAHEGELSTDSWKTLIDQAAEAGCMEFLLTGGEPMLRADFPAVFVHARTRGMIVTVFCNGTLVTDSVMDVFADLPPFLVEVTIYGSAAGTHDRVTQVPGSFARALAGVERLIQGGVRVGLKTILMTINRHELAHMEKLAGRLGTKWRMDSAVFPCLPHGDSGGCPNGRLAGGGEAGLSPLEFRVPPEDAAALECADPRRVQALRDAYRRPRGESAGTGLYTCGSGLTGFHIDPYGFLQPCVMTPGYRESAVELGFVEAWKRIRRIRDVEAPVGYECRTCDLLPVCSGCPALFDLENGSPGAKSEYICSLARRRRVYL